MTEQYKVGDKVLVEAEIVGASQIDGTYAHLKILNLDFCLSHTYVRPYTPRQEFEYGEEVEVYFEEHKEWYLAKYIGKTNEHMRYGHIVNPIAHGHIFPHRLFNKIRKPQPRETITIAGAIYDKAEFESALKNLKKVGE